MKTTVMIYDQIGWRPIQFCALKGDYSHLNGIYINEFAESEPHETLINELSDLMYDDGKCKQEMLAEFPIEAVRDGAVVIVAGFLS